MAKDIRPKREQVKRRNDEIKRRYKEIYQETHKQREVICQELGNEFFLSAGRISIILTL